MRLTVAESQRTLALLGRFRRRAGSLARSALPVPFRASLVGASARDALKGASATALVRQSAATAEVGHDRKIAHVDIMCMCIDASVL